MKAVKFFKGFSIVAVGLFAGFTEPNVSLFTEERRKTVESLGGKVVLAAPAFAGVGGATREDSHTHQNGDIIADTLRIFGQGMKVTCEIVLEAADAGLVATHEGGFTLVLPPQIAQDLCDYGFKSKESIYQWFWKQSFEPVGVLTGYWMYQQQWCLSLVQDLFSNVTKNQSA